MSFSLSVGTVAREEFEAAVEAAQESPPVEGDAGKAQIEFAKRRLIELASVLHPSNQYLSGTISGHIVPRDENDEPVAGWSVYDGITIGVNAQPQPVQSAEPQGDGQIG